MDRENIIKIAELFNSKDNFLLTAHVNPEGDSIGSQLAVYHMLKKLGKSVIVLNQDPVPENLKFLPGAEAVSQNIPEGVEDHIAVILDCPVPERIGNIYRAFAEEQFKVNIDHHVSNEFFGDLNWVDTEASSAGEMIYNLSREMKISIDRNIASNLYAAILTDTGMFNYDNTSAETHMIAGELLKTGVSARDMYGRIYEQRSPSEVRILGKVLNTLTIGQDKRIAHMVLTKDMCAGENGKNIPTDGFINFARSVKGVEVAVFFRENTDDPKKINISFRSSEKINVNRIASRFGGGGHTKASGCVLLTGLEQAKKEILSEVEKALRENM
ncbi:MAG: bifunctional oligoribonuclease/PAP phosphatase NrnA [Candidatus Omnitrophota bacterium]|nr:bifunctional oligoribonuclease/PAP phosphatase NrnA [Candidatus Omnitrophota bacterium]